MSEKLRRCPFCGGEADFWTRKAFESEDYQALIIDCKDCPANMEEWIYKYDKNFSENFEKKKAEMFEAWNRRIERTAKVSNQTFNNSNPYTVGAWIGTCECGELVSYSSKYCHMCGVRLE